MLRIFPLRRPRAAFCSPGTCAPSATSRLHSAGVRSQLAWVQHASLLSSCPLLLSASSGRFKDSSLWGGDDYLRLPDFVRRKKNRQQIAVKKYVNPTRWALFCTKISNVFEAHTNIRDLFLALSQICPCTSRLANKKEIRGTEKKPFTIVEKIPKGTCSLLGVGNPIVFFHKFVFEYCSNCRLQRMWATKRRKTMGV